MFADRDDTHFVWLPYFILLIFCTWGVVRGPHFCVKLKMCCAQFHMFGQMDKKIWKCSEMGS